ncbi:MAG: flagellar hook-length control protein FliK [Sulfuricurvum sp.]
MADVLKQASSEQLLQLTEGKDLKSILHSLFQAKIENTKSDGVLLDLLKNSATFKNMGNFTENLKSLLSTLKAEPSLAPKLSQLEGYLQHITTVDAANLKEKMSNSGVFDVKAQLLTLGEEIQESHPNAQSKIDQLLTQIDYHQLLSHLNNSNSLYFPFAWDQMEKGSLSLKKGKKDKFYCEINLTLKEYGEMDLMMGLYSENQLDIQIQTQQENFKTLLQDNLENLRNLLMNAGLSPRQIRITAKSETHNLKMSAYTQEESGIHTLFEERV